MGRFRLVILAVLVLLAPGAHGSASEGLAAEGLAATVLFNTACAHCHEGQCSGRLSFSQSREAAQGHIERYGRDLSPAMVDLLFERLRHMKEECAYYPMAVAVPDDLGWDEAALASLRSPQGTGYFLPLGELAVGTYRIDAASSEVRCLRISLIGPDFEPAHEQCRAPVDCASSAEAIVENPGTHHLRITAADPFTLSSLAVVALP